MTNSHAIFIFFLTFIHFLPHLHSSASQSCTLGFGRNERGQINSGTTGHLYHPTPVNFPVLFGKNITHVEAGGLHTILVDSNGRSYSFGRNLKGELGLGYVGGTSFEPMEIVDRGVSSFNSRRIVKAFGGFERTYLLDEHGVVFFLGVNDLMLYGPMALSSPIPLDFSLTNPVKDMSSSATTAVSLETSPYQHTLLLTDDGKALSFGEGRHGELGTGKSVQYEPEPLILNGELATLNISQVSAGSQHSVILSTDGRAWSFGRNHMGQLATNRENDEPYAVPIHASNALQGRHIQQISSGGSCSLFLTSDGRVYSSGENTRGAIGIGRKDVLLVREPTPMEGALQDQIVTQISAGWTHSLMLTQEGNVWGTGANSNGEFGAPRRNPGIIQYDDEDWYEPVKVDTSGVLRDKIVIRVSCGVVHSVFLCSDGSVVTTGYGAFGQLGTGSPKSSFLPALLSYHDALFVDSQCMFESNLYVSTEGKLYSSGNNEFGSLGDNTLLSRYHIHAVPTNEISGNIFQVGCGMQHSVALTSSGELFSWGQNSRQQLGQVNEAFGVVLTPRKVDATGFLKDKIITDLKVGSLHTLVLSSEGFAYTFGSNYFGQLGIRHNVDSFDGDLVFFPVAVNTSGVLQGKHLTQISAGDYHNLVLSSEGQVFSFGFGSLGQLGIREIDTFDDSIVQMRSHPVAVDTSGALKGKTVVQIAAGHSFSLVLTSEGKVVGFGANHVGQLGLGHFDSPQWLPIPVDTSGVLNGKLVTKISAGGGHSLVWISDSNELVSFGTNVVGMLGYETPDNHSCVPQRVPIDQSILQSTGDEVRIEAGFATSFLISCPRIKCFGTHHQHPLVCSHHGQCVGQNSCECHAEYTGPDCSFPICGLTASNDSAVCSSHGDCIAPNECVCKKFGDNEYTGKFCESYNCFDVPHDSSFACSSAGTCGAPNECTCNSMRVGKACAFNLWLIIGPLLAIIVLLTCIAAVGCVVCISRICMRLKRVEREKKMTQHLLEGFVKDEEMDEMDADSKRAKLIVQQSLLEIDFSELSQLEKIGSGGSGAILFRAQWNGSKVAVKVFKSGLMSGETFFQEFEHEVSLMSTLRHRNIINFFGCSLAFPRIAIIMELCDDGSVETLIGNGKLRKKSSHEVLQMLLDIAEGVLYLHSRGVIHRDLKCANVLIDEHGVAKITDFGLSKYTKDNIERMHTVGIGTSYYMAPEIAKGTGEYTENVDAYAFGILAMEMLLGRMCPFPANSASGQPINIQSLQHETAQNPNFRPDVNELESRYHSLQWILKLCWHHDPSMRPPFKDVAKILKSSLYDIDER
uniref:Protein kinase domain-containing protein n=1 Tax=Percolomonas cosmopolitus TaxID=63605 RepID=A0A7S1PI24_9EUKA